MGALEMLDDDDDDDDDDDHKMTKYCQEWRKY
jgi:hypothetical protein